MEKLRYKACNGHYKLNNVHYKPYNGRYKACNEEFSSAKIQLYPIRSKTLSNNPRICLRI